MKRRRGHLDAFSHLSLTRQWVTVTESGRRSAIWKLALIPRADTPATEPIVITFAGRDQTATATVPLCQRLAERVALPLQDESLEVNPESTMPFRVVGWFLLLFLCVDVLGSAYIGARNWYECRGARFPVSPGAPLPINDRMGACTVRSLEVTAGQSHRQMTGNGCGPTGHETCYNVSRPYSIALDIENTGSKLSTLNFVIGFDAQTQTHGSSGPLPPHTHRRVTVDVVKGGDRPDTLFLREEDGG